MCDDLKHVEKMWLFLYLHTADAKLPAIFICPKPHSRIKITRKNGYWNSYLFLFGMVQKRKDSVTWEGNNSMPYENLTNQMFESTKTAQLTVSGIGYIYSTGTKKSSLKAWYC